MGRHAYPALGKTDVMDVAVPTIKMLASSFATHELMLTPTPGDQKHNASMLNRSQNKQRCSIWFITTLIY
jgi:hypothetical protein